MTAWFLVLGFDDCDFIPVAKESTDSIGEKIKRVEKP
jgi:hypothetical protein